MSYLPASKFGECFQCGDKEVACAKVGKNLFCISKCHRDNKVKKQVQKANERNKVRGLVRYERAEGVLDNISELTLDLDRVVSRYVRLAAMGKDHKIECYCCGKKVDWKKAHAMHFINRQHISARFLLQNLKAGCFECNVEKRGNLEVYAENLEKETPGIVGWLTEQSHQVYNVTRDELKQTLHDYQLKLNTVENAKLKML